MPTFNRNDTNAILAFFGQTSTRGSTQPRDESYYTSNTPTNNRPASTRRPSSNVVTPTTAPGGLPPRRSSSTVPRDEAYYTSAKPTYKPPSAPKIKRNTTQPRDEEYYTTNDPPNRWRQEIQQPVFRGYDVGPGPQVNVSVGQRPNTGASAVQQSATVGGQTVRSPIAPRLPAYSGPRDDEFYTQRDAPRAPLRTPGQPPVAMAPSVLPVARAAWDMMPDSWDEAGQLARYGLQGWWGTVGDTAAVERAQSDIAARNQAFGERERSNWRDLGQSFGNAWDAMGDNRELIQQEAGQWWRGEQPLTQALTDYAGGVSISPAYEPLWRAADINTVTANAARMANNLATGLQGAQDLVYNQPWLPNNKALSDYMTPALETVQSDEAKRLLLAPSLGQDLGQAWQQFSQRFTRNFDAYQQAITPDAEQAKRLQPAQAQQQADRARLRSLAGSEFVGNVFDKLVNQQQNVDSLNQQALTLFQQGAQAIDEDLRQELWQKAAQLGADAYQLKSSHPIQLVNEGFSAQELLSQLVLPDVTDLAGGLFSVLQLTPKARRLTSTVNEVMTPQQQAVNALQEMIVTPATRTAMQAQRSDYNKLWNLWTTGNARANIATDKMVRYVVNLLSDTESPSDVRILLNQLATDPTKLLTGVDGKLFQSEGLINRALSNGGTVQFGSMNLQNLKEPLRVYQQAAENILTNSVALATSGPVLDKAHFIGEFIEGMKQAGYRFYNVADDAATVPLGTKTTRLRAVTGGQYVVEWVDGSKKVIGQSDPMLIQDARKLQNSFKGGQVTAPQSVINKAGSAMRKVVSIPYILGNPGTWVTNAVSGMATAVGDGVWSTATNRVMDEWKTKVFGIDPTVRGLEGADTGQGFAQNTMGGGVFSFLRNKYGQIDENAGRRVWHSSAQHALRQAGKPILQQTLTPILQGMGITNARQIKRITNHLFEVGYRGGDMVGEWARLMNGNARVFSLSDANPQWLGALSEPVLEQFYDILKTATTKEDAVTRLQAWTDSATKYWDDLLDGQTVTPQRHVWMKQETAQDAADLTQTARVAQKYGNVPADEVAAWTKQTATAMQDTQRRMETLMQLVADAKDPKNRYALYNAWGQITDLTADVRGQLLDLAEKAGQTPAGAARQSAWGQYWTEARRLWDERNTAVNNLLEQTAQAVTSGADFTPHLDVWKTLERSAQVNEAKLWDALRLEPQSGAYDQRLRQVIDAGRQIADKSMARVYAAARRFANVDAMDYIISAEHSVQTAGGQARAYLDKVLEKALKSGKWEDYYSIRNETWRQLRAYERDVWGIAERNIVQDGLAAEATTGLRFDAGPDGTVELLRPEQRTVQQTNRMGPEKTVTQRQVTEWSVKREDGTVTTVPNNMVPKELKDRYNGVTPEEIEAQTQLELDNIASAEPFAPEAQAILDGPTPTQAGQQPPTTQLYQPSQQQVEQVRTSVQKAIERSAQNNKLTPAQVEQYVQQALAQIAQADIAVAVPKSAIDNILSDGRLKTQFETGTSGATTNKAWRAEAEWKGLGIPETLPDAQRPIYGYMNFSPETRSLTQRGYGDITFILDEKVRPRTTIGAGDTMDNFRRGNMVAAPIDNPNILAADHEVSNLVDYARTGDAKEFVYSGVGYVEAQVQGGVSLDDVAYVLDEKGVLTPQQVQQFNARGIQVLQGDAAKTVGKLPARTGQQPATPAFTPSSQPADVEGFARFTATEPPTNAVEVRTVTPAQTAPLTLNDLRRLADEAGIQTASEAGQPINKRLLNTINKDLKIKATRLEDLTPDQIEQAAEALRRRASAAAPPAPTAPTAPAKPALAKSAEGFTAGDIKRGWQDYAYEYKVPPIDEIAARVKAGKPPLPKKQMDALSGLTIAGVKLTDQESVRRLVQQYIDLSENRRTLEFTVPIPDMEKWARENVAKSLNLSADLKPQAMATKAPVSAGDLGQGAAFAKQQIQNIYNHVVANLDEIMTPQRGIGQGQSLRAVDEFRTRVLPAWDNAKYIASEYGNRMRGFTMVDFANNTRLDELLSLYMPYGFWMTRTAKNSLERAIFQPQIWRRVMQTEQGVRDIQEQRGDPQRYEGAMPYDDGSGIVQYLRLLPSKYWQAAGLFTHNDYADPESANSALGFAVDSLRAANLNSYPWFDIGAKLADGEANDIYPVNYIPAARWISDLAIMAGGQGAANRWTVPGYFENSVARTLNNMAVKGEITKEQARWAHDLLWQQKQGGQPLPEQSTVANMEEISAILDTAMRTAAGQDFQGSFTSWLSGVGVRPFDQAENTWTGAQQEYYENQYGPQNPYGSHLASQAVRDDAVLNWSKSGVWKPEEGRPGQMLVNDLKKQEKESVNQDLMSATDTWILAQKEPPTNGEINDFKAQYVIGKYGDQDVQPTGDFQYPFFADVITAHLDNKYPSAQPFEGDGGPRYQGYAPEETREKVRTAAYYQALDELEDEKPTSPGKGKSREEYKAYDEDKRAYEAELEARVTELISDPQWLAIQAGTFLRTTRTGESEGSYRLLAPTMDNAFTSPQRPTGDATDPYMSGLVPLAGSPADAKAIIEQEKTKYMGPVEKATRAANEENGDKDGFYARGNRRYSSRTARRYSRGGGGRRYYGGGGGGGGFRYTDMPQAQGLSSSLWSQDDVRAWRPWNNQANDWLRSGQELRPDRLEDWRPLRV